ncbi:VOC family protein [Sinisalibacter aestuarii]|uniref:Glyoxalase n=1 Tax=Sinisalibacter aestuarii TaxID=2949426 RepID=A0ABQ5LPP2_9RHOB|nr:VOC family protein [Sinisalibacter aestuarii]GKY86713.1 glyoxalase [Sinisalibacter aestuarii]
MTLPMNRVTFITLAVADLARARAYYEALGWEVETAMDEVAFYAMRGQKLGLFTLEGLAKETGRRVDDLRTGAMTLAQNQPSPEAVDAAFAHAVACGAAAVTAPFKTDWGGYSSYVADPDGHLWEFAYNPFSPLDDEGHIA